VGLEVRFEGRSLVTVSAIITGAPTAIVAPESIDNTGVQNASAGLTNWLLTAGNPGSTFQLRRRPGDLPGRYWVPQGVKLPKAMTLDLNGCDLFTGTTLGFDDPLHADPVAARAAFPPLWNDWDEQSVVEAWPDRRCVVVIAASNLRLFSSRPTSRIQGANFLTLYKGGLTNVGRQAPTGCIDYVNAAAGIFIGDGQHGIRIGGKPGAYSSDPAHSYSDIEIDLTNISVEFNHADGIYLGDNHRRIRIHGQQVGEPVLGGVPHPIDDGVLLGWSGQGANIVTGAGSPVNVNDPRTTDRWEPWSEVLPGIHHFGRMGIACGFRTYDVTIEGFSMWRSGHSLIDWEPASTNGEIIGATIRDMELGIHHLLAMPCAGLEGPINDLVFENIVSYEAPGVTRKPSGSEPASIPLDSRCSNWRLQNVVCPTGVKVRNPDVFVLPGIDGVQVRDCYVLVKGTAVGAIFDVGWSPPLHASTGVVVSPTLSVQFPFTP
jgi:hypothetical protein